jgi:protein SCO1/2
VRALGLLALLLAAAPARAGETQPAILRDIGFDQHLGASVPMDTVLRGEDGRAVRFGDLFRGRPVVLTLNYYACPMLCTVSLNGLAMALNVLRFDAGREFEIVTLSFDPKETAELAAAKKKSYLTRYQRPGADGGWRFLTGDAAAIKAIATAVGFRYAWDTETQQFAHPAGVVVLTPQGTIARYLYGIEYAPNDLRLALVEAAASKIGTPVDQFLLLCYQYDPATGRYGAAIMRTVRIGGILTVASLLTFIITMLRRERVAAAAPPRTP